MGWSPRCSIPYFVEMGQLVLEKIFEVIFTIYEHSSHFGHVTQMVQTIFRSSFLRASIENLALIGQVVWEKKMFEIVDGWIYYKLSYEP